MNAYAFLAIAICAEVIATVSMKAVKGLSTPLPLILVTMITIIVKSLKTPRPAAAAAATPHQS